MEKRLGGKEKLAYGLGAVGKDMVYMLSASYILYYYQDLLGVSSWVMGIILMAARIFDAFNDPIMGVIVAKTQTRWGKFRPWLLIGTVLNAFVLYFMFAVPKSVTGGGLVAYAAVLYITWGITYTMMDIPFWSMIPAFTEGGKEREGLSTLARSCAGVGSAIITVITMICVPMLGKIGMAEVTGSVTDNLIERNGFKWFALIIAVLFVVFITITCICIKEKSTVNMQSPTVGQMFRALFSNDQAVTVVLTIVLINCSLYITSNLLIYFFKYDIGGANWNGNYVLFNTVGGAVQILSMMIFYPMLRKFMSSIKVFYVSFGMAITGYLVLFVMMCAGVSNVYLLLAPGFFIFAAFGMLTVLTTVFLANTVDYGELKNNRRDESIIFSMQTFVVKLASGVAILAASICISVGKISKDTTEAVAMTALPESSRMVLRMTMAVIPIIGLVAALIIFVKKYILTDEKLEEITTQLASKRK
ncbi:MAG: glycoside-pentoside-hexuronide (GPH):cation symporter [Lachnospiraceae bacterium]